MLGPQVCSENAKGEFVQATQADLTLEVNRILHMVCYQLIRRSSPTYCLLIQSDTALRSKCEQSFASE